MKSIKQREEQYYGRMNKKGQVIDTATGVAVGLFIFILITFVILLAISSLNPSSFFTAGSAERNTTNQITQNYTAGINEFFTQVPTAMKILGIVLLLGFLALLISIVVRFRGASGGGGL
jgi:hypothetical protein